MGSVHQLLGEVVAQGITALKGLVRAVGITAGAVVVVHGGLGAGGTALQVGIIHQLLGEVVAQGGLQEGSVGVVSLGGIHVAVLVGKILAAVGAVPVGIVAGLGAGGCLGFRLVGRKMVIGVLIRQLVAADLALELGYAGGFIAGVGLVGRLLGAAVVLADLPVAGGIALIGLALVVMAQGGQQEGSVGGESGGRIQLAVLIGIVVAAVGAVPIGQVAAHLAGGSHSGRLGGASMGQRSNVKVRGIVIEVLVAVLEILVAVGAIAICLVSLAAAGGSGGSGGGNLGCRMVVGIELAVLALTDGTHSLGGAGGGGVGGVIFPLLGGAAGHGAGAPVLGVVMLPTTPDMISGVLDGEGPGGCREAIGGSEVTVAGDDQIHLVGAGIGGACHHLAALLIHQRSGLALGAQSVGSVQGDGGGLGVAVPNQVFRGSEDEVGCLGRSLGDDPGDGVVGDSAAPLVSILVQLHSGGVVARVGGFGDAVHGVALATYQQGALFTSIGIAQSGCGEADRLEILGHGHSDGIGGVGNIRCLDADIVGALAAYGGRALDAGGPGLAVGGLGPLHGGVGAADFAVHGLPGAGSHAGKAAGSGGGGLGGGGGEGQSHFIRRGGAGDGDLGEAVTGDGDAVLGQIGRIVLGEVIAVCGGDGHIRNGAVLQNRLLQVAGGGHVLAPGDGDGAGLGDDVKLVPVGIQLHLIALIAGEIVLVARVAGDIDGADDAVIQGLHLGGDTDGGASGEVGDGGEHSPDGDVVVACSFADLVAGDVHLAGQLDGPAHICIIGGVGLGFGRAMHAGACTGGGVAGDGGAAAEVERADGSYAAADVSGVIADGGVFDDSRMIGIGRQIVLDRGVPLLGFIVFSGSDIQAAAAAGGGVAGDGGAVNSEEAVTRVNAAAVGGFVAGDGTAVDGDGAARAVHAAAVAVVVGGIGLDSVAGDGTGVHSEGAAGHIDAAAVAAGSRAAGDGTAVHDEGALHIGAAAVAVVRGTGGRRIRLEIAEAAAPQGEGTLVGYRHALMAGGSGELAGALVGAVGNGGADIFAYNDTGGVATGFEGVGVAIEAEVAVAHGSPGSTIGIITTILQQEVVALGQIFQRGNADPLDILVGGAVAVGGVFPGAADAVGVAGTLVPQLQAGIAGGQQGAGLVGGGAQGVVAAAIREEARGVGGALYGQSGNIVGGDTDMALGGVEAAVHGDIGTGGSGAIQMDIVSHAICGIVLGDDRAAQYGGNVFDILHIDGAAFPFGRVAGEGAVGDLCFIAMQR